MPSAVRLRRATPAVVPRAAGRRRRCRRADHAAPSRPRCARSARDARRGRAALPELTRARRALGLLALCGWSVGVVLGALDDQGQHRAVPARATSSATPAACSCWSSWPAARAIAGWRRCSTTGRSARPAAPSACTRSRSACRRSRSSVSCRFSFAGAPGTGAISRSCSWSRSSACARARRCGRRCRARRCLPGRAPRPGVAVRAVLDRCTTSFAGRRWRACRWRSSSSPALPTPRSSRPTRITFHHNLRTAAYDLGLEDNLVWNVLHGIGFFRSTPFSGPTGSHFGNHATFFSYVIAPFYALAQGAATLLFIQSLMIGVAAIPLFLVARRHLGAWAGCLIALCYLLYPPNHGANLYEFHYIPFGAFFLWTTLYLFETHHDRWGIVFTILALSVREDIGGAGVAVLGAYLLISGERPRVGLALAIVGRAALLPAEDGLHAAGARRRELHNLLQRSGAGRAAELRRRHQDRLRQPVLHAAHAARARQAALHAAVLRAAGVHPAQAADRAAADRPRLLLHGAVDRLHAADPDLVPVHVLLDGLPDDRAHLRARSQELAAAHRRRVPGGQARGAVRAGVRDGAGQLSVGRDLPAQHRQGRLLALQLRDHGARSQRPQDLRRDRAA